MTENQRKQAVTGSSLQGVVRLVGEYLSLLEIVETTDDGREFRPNQLGSCRAIDGHRMNEILTQLRQIVDQSNH